MIQDGYLVPVEQRVLSERDLVGGKDSKDPVRILVGWWHGCLQLLELFLGIGTEKFMDQISV